MTTYRERREHRAEKLREWGEARVHAATSTVEESHRRYSGDHAFNFQPGHIPEREREIKRLDRAFQSWDKGEKMQGRAAGIEAQLDGAIYSDDPDAVEQLEARITTLEAKRETIKAHNREHRGSKHCTHAPGCACRSPYEVARCGCTAHPMATYVLTNLGADIRRNQQRLDQLRREKVNPGRRIYARFDSECSECGGTLHKGEVILYNRSERTARHPEGCPE